MTIFDLIIPAIFRVAGKGLCMDVENFGSKELALAGKALFGERWQTDLTRALGLSDARRIRQWLTPKGKQSHRPIPPGVWDDIIKLLEERKIEIDKVLQHMK